MAVSMDGRGRCLDNVFVERLWRSVKYEDVYLARVRGGAGVGAGAAGVLPLLQRRAAAPVAGVPDPGGGLPRGRGPDGPDETVAKDRQFLV